MKEELERILKDRTMHTHQHGGLGVYQKWLIELPYFAPNLSCVGVA